MIEIALIMSTHIASVTANENGNETRQLEVVGTVTVSYCYFFIFNFSF